MQNRCRPDSTIFAVFGGFGGKNHNSLPLKLHVIICKTLKFQHLGRMPIFRTTPEPGEKTKKFHHFGKNLQKWWNSTS